MRNFIERDFPALIDLLYDAALDPTRWQVFLDALPDTFGNARGVVHSYNATTDAVPFFAAFGHDPAFSSSYLAHYSNVNPYPTSRFHNLLVGRVHYSTDYLSAET